MGTPQDDVFLTPKDDPPPKNGKGKGKGKGKGEKEKKKRNRSDRDETSESDVVESDAGSYASSKKGKFDEVGTQIQEGEEIIVVGNVQDVIQVPVGEQNSDMEEKELMELIKEIEQVIKKARNTSMEVTQALRKKEDPDGVLQARGRSVQTERHLRLAASLARSLDLLASNIKLREELQWENKYSQCSPAFLRRGRAEEEKEREEERRKQGRKEGGKESTIATKGKIEETREKTIGKTKKGKNRKGNKTEREEDSDTQSEEPEEWRIVDRKKREEDKKKAREAKKKMQEEEANRKREEEMKKRIRKAPPPPKSEAIVVKATSEKTFADLFKKLKTEAADKMEGIQMVRRSRGGDLIIEMEKNSNPLAMEQTVRATLGKEFTVRKLTPRVSLEIKDLDPTMEKEEIRHAIAGKLDLGEMAESEVEVRAVRFGFGGTRTAIVTVPVEVANKLGEESKIKIGFTNCRVSRAMNITRCYRCHAFGHMSYECKEKLNGKEMCRRCGTEGHQINGCNATRCCILCIRQGIPAANAEHVAGAINCPQYKKFVLEANKRN